MNKPLSAALDTPFKKDVYEGLSHYPKYLYSKYIYDKAGDLLFQKIMDLPEYYLTTCEFEILSLHTAAIANHFKSDTNGFDLIELGAGDGKKTKLLLRHLSEQKFDFTYKPIDISANAIANLTRTLHSDLPKVKVEGETGEYFEVLKRLKKFDSRKKVIMVLGSNIGNLLHPRAIKFLSHLKDSMHKEDMVLIGFDQKKNPQTVLDAYNDDTGVTEAFNKNLLVRINRELDANFDPDRFLHWETYDPETGTARSYLVAREAHEVTIRKLDLNITFDKWETIHTEISQKYDDKVVKWLAAEAALEIITDFTDSKSYYKNYIFKRRQGSDS